MRLLALILFLLVGCAAGGITAVVSWMLLVVLGMCVAVAMDHQR